MKSIHLDAGAFRDRLILQENELASDGSGGFSDTWHDVGQVWARILPVRQGTVQRVEIQQPEYTYIIDIRQPSDAKVGMRFSDQLSSRKFLIEAISDPDETGRYHRCQCRQEGNGL